MTVIAITKTLQKNFMGVDARSPKLRPVVLHANAESPIHGLVVVLLLLAKIHHLLIAVRQITIRKLVSKVVATAMGIN